MERTGMRSLVSLATDSGDMVCRGPMDRMVVS